jgi:cystathionine beta-lyase/cystathionine gamma-synthase
MGSGMSAIAITAMTYCKQGDHLLASAELYGGTLELLNDVLPGTGVEVEWVPLEAASSLGSRVRPNTRLVLVESPTNPLLRLIDFEALFASFTDHRPVVALDATFATPLGHRALAAGFDLVIHSATKFMGGHDDLLAGVVSGSRELVEPIRDLRRIVGTMSDPHTAWLLDRSLKTLAVRWERQCDNAQALAQRLEAHPSVTRVHYPGLASHPQHQVAVRQMERFGSMLAFEIAGGYAGAERVFNGLRIVRRATTLGGVESNVVHPATSSHRMVPPEERDRLGIGDGVLRFSTGIEDLEDLWGDLFQALEARPGFAGDSNS